MAKKTYADRLGQYLSMLQGNDVEEYFNSERTAKAEYHKMIEVIQYWYNPYLNYVTRDKDKQTPENLDWSWRWIENNTGARREELEPIYEELLKIKEKGKLRTDCCSVKNAKIYHETPHYSIYRRSFNGEQGYYATSGKYTAYCQQRTNTSKQRTIDNYHEGIEKMRELYGLCSCESLPSAFTVYSTNPTEYMYAQVMGLINSILDGTTPAPRLEPCSPKQALWVSKKMGVPEEVAIDKLNKIQASELLDVLFNGEENRMLLNPDEVFAHYRAILGINEGGFSKLPIIMEKADNNKTYIMRRNILTENRLNRIVENAVKQVLREDEVDDRLARLDDTADNIDVDEDDVWDEYNSLGGNDEFGDILGHAGKMPEDYDDDILYDGYSGDDLDRINTLNVDKEDYVSPALKRAQMNKSWDAIDDYYDEREDLLNKQLGRDTLGRFGEEDDHAAPFRFDDERRMYAQTHNPNVLDRPYYDGFESYIDDDGYVSRNGYTDFIFPY